MIDSLWVISNLVTCGSRCDVNNLGSNEIRIILWQRLSLPLSICKTLITEM